MFFHDTLPPTPDFDPVGIQVQALLRSAADSQRLMDASRTQCARLPKVLSTGQSLEQVALNLTRAIGDAENTLGYLADTRDRVNAVLNLLEAAVQRQAVEDGIAQRKRLGNAPGSAGA